MSKTEMTGSQMVWNILKDEGVEYVFGVSGISVMSLLRTLTQMPDIRYIHAAHESVSMGMADGYARASGKLGVVLVHSTPGLSNVMGNLHNAYSAGTPILVIAGRRDSRVEWSDRFIDVDFLPMVSQVTKGRWMINRAEDVPIAFHHALKEANTPPKRPVFLGIPEDVQVQTASYQPMPPQGRHLSMNISPESESLRRAAQLLMEADKPLIFAGHEVPDDNAVSELVNLAEAIGAPVYCSEEYKLIFPTNHPLYCGKARAMSAHLRWMISSADVLLSIGSDLFKQVDYSETPLFESGTKMIQIDLNPQGLARFYPTEVALLASPKIALNELASVIDGSLSTDQRQKCQQRFEKSANIIREKKAALEASFNADYWNAIPMKSLRALKEIADGLPSNTVIVDETSTLTGIVAQSIGLSDPGSYLYCVDSLGWGLPASLGAAVGSPERPVIAIVGDGTALMSIQALWTAARYQIPVAMVIFNNGGYAAIRGLFKVGYGGEVSPPPSSEQIANYDIGDVSFVKLASDFGISAQRVEDPSKIGATLDEAVGLKKPVLIEIMLDPEM